jgi:hypothetical protein
MSKTQRKNAKRKNHNPENPRRSSLHRHRISKKAASQKMKKAIFRLT